jgi:hypothetical protein
MWTEWTFRRTYWLGQKSCPYTTKCPVDWSGYTCSWSAHSQLHHPDFKGWIILYPQNAIFKIFPIKICLRSAFWKHFSNWPWTTISRLCFFWFNHESQFCSSVLLHAIYVSKYFGTKISTELGCQIISLWLVFYSYPVRISPNLASLLLHGT